MPALEELLKRAFHPFLPPSLLFLSLYVYIYIFFFYRLFHLFLFSFLQQIYLSLSLLLISSNILALLHSSAFVFRRSRISRSYFDPRLLTRGILCLSSSASFLPFPRRMARRRPDPSTAYRSESERRGWPKRDGRRLVLFVSLSYSRVAFLVGATKRGRSKTEEARGRRINA